MTSASMSSPCRCAAAVAAQRAVAIFAAFVVGLSLASCEVGPDYFPPAIALAPFHNAQAVDERAANHRRRRSIRWWTGFEVPS